MPLGNILEELVLCADFVMAFVVVHHLSEEILGHSLKINAFWRWGPPHVEVADWSLEVVYLFVDAGGSFVPNVRTGL